MNDPALDALFRRHHGTLLGALTRHLGSERFELAEEVLQEALLSALKTWPIRGVPDDPFAWLLTTARNRALDELRRSSRFRGEMPVIAQTASQEEYATSDSKLRLMFMCCHPSLSRADQIALTLKSVAGFETAEIARVFFEEKSTIAQRLVRAKKRIQKSALRFEMPSEEKLPGRLGAVLDAIYLIFNEGYTLRDGGHELLSRQVAEEAIVLGRELAEMPRCGRPETHALCALMLFQASRFRARVDANGALLTLAEQDRTTWNQIQIASGLKHLERAGRGNALSEYHLLAGIAACHATTPSYDAINWTRVVSLYDVLMERNPSPLIRLNRAVAVSMASGPAAGLALLNGFSEPPYQCAAARGDMLARIGETELAARKFESAARLAPTEIERRYFEKQQYAVKSRSPI